MLHEKSTPQHPQSHEVQDRENYTMQRELAALRWNPSIEAHELSSSNAPENPERQGVRIALGTPIETAVSPNTDVEQDLMAVLSLGRDVEVGIVRGRNKSGDEVFYTSLMNNGYHDPTGGDGRAKRLETVRSSSPVTITREMIEALVNIPDFARGVSRTHCTIQIENGVLTVVDERSSNGTSVFTNATGKKQRQFGDISQWSQPSKETEGLIRDEVEAQRLARTSKLGKFTLSEQQHL